MDAIDVGILNILQLNSRTPVNVITSYSIHYTKLYEVRAFPSLVDKKKDESEYVLNSFVKYATVPVVNMESATAHPLQALADAITISEMADNPKPKVVLSWAPHPRALPQAVANSFVEMMQKMEVDFTITHPEGYSYNFV